jgi:hypothetical protein
VNLTVTVGVEPNFYAPDVGRRAREAVEALFALENADFGKPFYLSKVFEAVERIDGVAFVEVPVFQGRRSFPPNELVDPAAAALGRIPLRPREFPRAGTLNVSTLGGLS